MATILVVDDYPAARQGLVTLLKDSGHRLLEAADGMEALALLRWERPDLVIADILMPAMDGYEFVRQLRADPLIARTPVIFYTAAYHKEEAESLAQACGVFQVITKPSTPEVVRDSVRAALSLTKPLPSPPLSETFDREHVRLLTDKLAEKVAQLEQQLAYRQGVGERLAAKARFLQAQIDILKDGVSTLKPEVFGSKPLEAIARAQGYAHGRLWRVAEGGQEAVVVASLGEDAASFLGRRRERRRSRQRLRCRSASQTAWKA